MKEIDAVKDAYLRFRGGFVNVPPMPPSWDELDDWVRDALGQMYLAGFFASPRKPTSN